MGTRTASGRALTVTAARSRARPGQLIARGTRSAVHAYGSGAVLKLPDVGTPASWIACEAEYSELVRAAGAPAPRLLGIEWHDGRAASVWERIPGPSMWQAARAEPGRCAEYGALLAELQRDLFALVPPVLLPRQQDRLVSKVREGAARVGSSLRDVLAEIPPSAGSLRICHGDLHPGNVILGPDGPVVIDWFDASKGDPLADIARTSILMRPGMHGEAPAHLPGAGPATLGILAAAHMAASREHHGFTSRELERWCAVEAVARIAEGVPAADLLELWRARR